MINLESSAQMFKQFLDHGGFKSWRQRGSRRLSAESRRNRNLGPQIHRIAIAELGMAYSVTRIDSRLQRTEFATVPLCFSYMVHEVSTLVLV